MNLSRLRPGLIRHLPRDSRGVAAIEFCLIAPIMIALLGGVFELSCLLRANTGLDHATHAMAKMIAQQPLQVSPAQLDNLCRYGIALEMAQHMPANRLARALSVTVAGYSKSAAGAAMDGHGTITTQTSKGIDWRYDPACPGRSGGLSSAEMTNLAAMSPSTGDAWIVVRSTLRYSFPVTIVNIPLFDITSVAYQRPRFNGSMPCPDCGS